MMAKNYLACVGFTYLLLAAWCIALPATTAASVGFELQPGSGQSEYLVVYGGLQLGLGGFFLWSVFWKPETVLVAIVSCIWIHGAIVFFRTISLFLYRDLGGTTLILAVVEWVILLAAAGVWFRSRGSDPSA
jgi:hypothetical protein